jgi:thiamine pyrophosphokinase
MSGERRVLVFGGGRLGDWAINEIHSGDVLAGADRGALFLLKHGYRADIAIGDFDSVNAEEKEEIRRCSGSFQECDPVMKDWTDMEMALHWALEQRPREIVLLGGLGTRFDHSLANIHLLQTARLAGTACRIVDEHNEIILMERYHKLTRNTRFTHVSLLPLSMEVMGITLLGFRYPLQDATLKLGDSLGISNVLDAEEGEIFTKEGLLLVIRSAD